MRVGVPREIKNAERRVGLTPASVRELVAHGHDVVVESSAGAGIGATDDHYASAGAGLVATAAEVFGQAELIVKVKEPQAGERAMLRLDQALGRAQEALTPRRPAPPRRAAPAGHSPPA